VIRTSKNIDILFLWIALACCRFLKATQRCRSPKLKLNQIILLVSKQEFGTRGKLIEKFRQGKIKLITNSMVVAELILYKNFLEQRISKAHHTNK